MRRTKEEAERTRRRIMVALRAFNRRRIARTMLVDMAKAARVTRGAIAVWA